ncbi:hypothetical protein B0H13DRAFT_1867394 [Mycena leptocephala]|nr:hypothetical protein B0H13DRAFT_1867394 [Mycena leptocephala]
MSGDKPWSLRPRKSDGLAATSIASGYTQAPKKKSSTSAHVSSGSSVSYIDSGSDSGSEDDDLPDPATLLASVPSKSAKSKVRKRSVDAMDVDEEPAAPPNKKANRAGKGGSAVSNAAETPLKAKERPLPRPKFSGARSAGERNVESRRTATSSSAAHPAAQSSTSSASRPRTRTIDLDKIELEEALRIDDSFDFEINRSEPSGISRMYEFAIQDAEEIGRTYKPLEAKDPATFRKTMDYFSMPGFALSQTGEWLHSNGGSLPELVTFYNTLHIILVTVRYRYGAIDPLEPLPSDPDHQIFFDGMDPQPQWRHYTREAFPPFDGQRHLVMNKYDEAWAEYRRKFAEHEASENGKEAAFTARQRTSYSEWEERGTHQSQRILEYIGLRQKVLSDVEHRLNTLGCYILFRIRAQFEDEDRALGSAFSAPSSQPPYRPPARTIDAPPTASSSRNRGKVVVDAPAIAVLEAAPASDSDDEPLSASRDAKSKGKGRIIVVPKSSSKKKAAERASSERAASDHAESDEGGESDGEEVDPITRSVKVKRGRKTVTIDLTGPRNRYNSSEWHAAHDLFVYAWPTTASGNKIVTHGYPFDEKHPRFSATWKRQITLASLPVRAFFTHGTGCVRCYLGRNDCIRLHYGEEPPTGACAHCRVDNASCVRCPVSFDWTITGKPPVRLLTRFPQSFADDLVPADAALPEINTEYFELQQALMLDIAEEVAPAGTTERLLGLVLHQLRLLGTEADLTEAHHAAYGGAFAAHPDSRFEYKLSGAFTRGGDNEGSATEVDEKVEDEENAAMPPASESGVSNEGPPPSASASISGPSTPRQPFLCVCPLALPTPRLSGLRATLCSFSRRRSFASLEHAPTALAGLLPDSCVLYRRVLDARPDFFHLREARSRLGRKFQRDERGEPSVTFPLGEATQRARSRARESSWMRRRAQGQK